MVAKELLNKVNRNGVGELDPNELKLFEYLKKKGRVGGNYIESKKPNIHNKND